MKKWKHLIRGEFEGYQNCLDEERAVRRDLDDKDWWYWRLLQQTNKQTNKQIAQNPKTFYSSSFSTLKYLSYMLTTTRGDEPCS